MGKAEREKGKRGEREWRDEIRKVGVSARRGRQYSGDPGSPDVVSGFSRVHWEVKRTEKCSPYAYLAQAVADAGDGVPIVAHKQNGKDWLCILPASALLRLLIDAGYSDSDGSPRTT
jgi:Holliday junction resolvase